MRKLFSLLTMLLLCIGSICGQVTVSPSTGVYWKNGAQSSDAWAPQWKSNAKAANRTTPLLIFTGETGMDTSTGNIYSNQTYTLQAPEGYVISSYTINGTATGADITITPAGGSGTTITSGNRLAYDLSVVVGVRETSFALSSSGDAHFESLSLVVVVSPMPVTIAMTSTNNLPNAYGTFSGQTYTTNDESGLAGVIVTASSGLTIGEATVNVANYGKCFSLVTAAAATDYTVTMTAPSGYVITGYYLGCSANTNDARHTLTSEDGNVTIEATSPTYQNNASKPFDVTGLNTTSTYFKIRTANKGNTLYLPQFYIKVAKIVNNTYNVIFNGEQVATGNENQIIGTVPAIPSSLQRPYSTYEYYSDADCTTPLAVLPSTATTVYAKCTWTPPFTVSSSFETATWYYATLRGKQLRADESAKDGSGRYSTSSTNGRTDVYKWAFFGNPYGIYVMNKNQGNGKYMYKQTQIIFSNPADPTADDNALWAVTPNSNGGFTLRNIAGGSTWYVNDAGNNGNLGFWNSVSGKNDAGSNWVIEETTASDLRATIASAQSLVVAPGVIGYPSVAGAEALSTAITTAQSVLDNDNGDYVETNQTLVTAIETAKGTINYTPRTDKYYTIVNARGAMVYDPSHSGSVDNSHDNAEYLWYGSTTPDATVLNNLWGFIEQDGNYYMYNVGKRQFATVGHGTYGNTWIFSDTPAYITLDDGIADEIAVPKVRVRATIATTGQSYTMSVSTGYTGPVITYDANGDGGVPMTFAESSVAVDPDITDIMVTKVTDLTPFREALQDAIDACKAKVGTGVNQYESNSAYTTALSAAETEVDNVGTTKGSLQDAKSDLETAYAALTLNMPTAGKFYRIKGKTSNKYMAAGMANNKYAMSDATDATTIFYYADSKLMNYNDGKYNAVKSDNWNWSDNSVGASTVTFSDGESNGGYRIYSQNVYLYDGGNNLDRGNSYNDNVRYHNWYLEEVTELPARTEAGQAAVGNGITFAPAGTTVAEGVSNVIVATATDGTYTCNNLQLDDNNIAQLGSITFTETNVTYTRAESANQWGTICLPYAAPTNGDVAYYTLAASQGSSLRFEKVTSAYTTKNTPYLIKKAANAGLEIGNNPEEEFSVGVDAGSVSQSGYKLQGVLENTSVIDGDKYTVAKDATYTAVTDGNAYYFDAANNNFRKLNGRFNLKAFRAYLTKISFSDPDPARSSIGIEISDDEATGISFVESEDGKTVDVVFDLNGRRQQQLQKGINIVNGKKVLK